MKNGKKAVFLDKDGTLVENVPYNADPRVMTLLAGAREGLQSLRDGGFQFVVISNQSGVARGYFRERELLRVKRRLRTMFSEIGVPLLGFYYCPHAPDGVLPDYAITCSCRKPAPGLLLDAARRHGIDLSRSWLVGDILDDVEAGHRAGCRSILLQNNHETEWVMTETRVPDFTASDLVEAASIILSAHELSQTAVTEGVYGCTLAQSHR